MFHSKTPSTGLGKETLTLARRVQKIKWGENKTVEVWGGASWEVMIRLGQNFDWNQVVRPKISHKSSQAHRVWSRKARGKQAGRGRECRKSKHYIQVQWNSEHLTNPPRPPANRPCLADDRLPRCSMVVRWSFSRCVMLLRGKNCRTWNKLEPKASSCRKGDPDMGCARSSNFLQQHCQHGASIQAYTSKLSANHKHSQYGNRCPAASCSTPLAALASLFPLYAGCPLCNSEARSHSWPGFRPGNLWKVKLSGASLTQVPFLCSTKLQKLLLFACQISFACCSMAKELKHWKALSARWTLQTYSCFPASFQATLKLTVCPVICFYIW